MSASLKTNDVIVVPPAFMDLVFDGIREVPPEKLKSVEKERKYSGLVKGVASVTAGALAFPVGAVAYDAAYMAWRQFVYGNKPAITAQYQPDNPFAGKALGAEAAVQHGNYNHVIEPYLEHLTEENKYGAKTINDKTKTPFLIESYKVGINRLKKMSFNGKVFGFLLWDSTSKKLQIYSRSKPDGPLNQSYQSLSDVVVPSNFK